MKGGAVWGNSRYGISNGGNMVLSGNLRTARKTDLPDTRPSQKGKIQAGGIYNTGELSANAREVVLTWEGDESGCGLYNNGGRAVWNGSISGNFRYGICNAGGGTVEIRDKGSVAFCRWGIYNKKEQSFCSPEAAYWSAVFTGFTRNLTAGCIWREHSARTAKV